MAILLPPANIAGVAVAHVNGFVAELRRLFLVEDLVDSIKFGVILWVLTYIGGWFNGMTLVILGNYVMHLECANYFHIVMIFFSTNSFRLSLHLAKGVRKQQTIN